MNGKRIEVRVGIYEPENQMISVPEEHPVQVIHQSRIPGSDAELSQNLFVGKVIERVGVKSPSRVPETQFAVQVIYGIKGDLTGTVTVNQEGGYKDGVLYVVDSDRLNQHSMGHDGYLLRPGSTYTFATRYSKECDWHTLIPGSNELIAGDGKLGSSALKELREQSTTVINWRKELK